MALFFGIMFASMLDPLSAAGYLIAGLALKRYLVAVCVAIAWRFSLALLLGVVQPRLIPALVGAVLVTSLVFWIRRMFRRRAPDSV